MLPADGKMLPCNYASQGLGPGIVFLHGLAASLRDWNQLLPALAQAGWQAAALDLLGHGASAHPQQAAAYTAQAVYDHFCGWLESMQLKGPLVLVGHSFGGYLSLLHALHEPQSVRALILIDPFYSPRQLAYPLRLFHRQGRTASAALRYIPTRLMTLALGFTPNHSAFSPDIRRQIAADVKRAAPEIMNIPGSMLDLTSCLPQIRQPVLLLWGERDPTLTPASFERLQAGLPAAQGSMIPGSFHQPHLTASAQVLASMQKFLEQI
jgi:pimeloyl-ACP methyl ester carboxylesterase